MRIDPDREAKWLAYHLGELDDADRAAVEADLRECPEAAASYARIVEEVSAWATEPVAHTPLRMEDLALGTVVRKRGIPVLWPVAAMLAACALLVLAFSQTAFTLQFGSVALHWRQTPPVETAQPEVVMTRHLEEAVLHLADRMQILERAAAEQGVQLKALAQRSLAAEEAFGNSMARLAAYQQAESRTRYRDVETLMRLASQ